MKHNQKITNSTTIQNPQLDDLDKSLEGQIQERIREREERFQGVTEFEYRDDWDDERKEEWILANPELAEHMAYLKAYKKDPTLAKLIREVDVLEDLIIEDPSFRVKTDEESLQESKSKYGEVA
jgi:hypothetical protein